jgi:PAS domain S-box-containing protein
MGRQIDRSSKAASPGPETLITGASALARLIRTHDWEETPLGPIEDWSETLLSTINLMLHSPFPTILAWGPEMVFLYNDAAIPTLMGKHPAALGDLYRNVFREAWDLVSSDLNACFLRGETAVRDNVFIPILLNGVVEDHYWSYSLIPVYENGQIAGVYDAYRNTTEIVLGSRRLRESEARLKMATDVAELGMFVWQVSGGIATWENHRMYQIFGRDPEEGPIQGPTFINEIIHPDSLEAFHSAMQLIAEGGNSFYFEGKIRRRGEIRWVEITGWLQTDEKDSALRMLGTVRDVTRAKKNEAALRTAEKLGAVGRLSASIAHEINNPLESLMNLLYLARGSQDFSDAQTYLDTADQELRRVAEVTSQTLRFFHQSTRPKEVYLEYLLGAALSLYQSRLAGFGVEIQTRLRAKQSVNCHDREIRQVLNNLIGNAMDAMRSKGGRLLIRTRASTNFKTGKKGLTLTVADTGHGMSPEVRKQIFDPFFTTRGFAGTGLGLWVSADIVKRHQGTLRVRSKQQEKGSGTVFTLFLPFDK